MLACQLYPECQKEKHPQTKEKGFYLLEDGFQTKEFVFLPKHMSELKRTLKNGHQPCLRRTLREDVLRTIQEQGGRCAATARLVQNLKGTLTQFVKPSGW